MKKKLQKKINLYLSLIIVIVLLPLLLTIFLQQLQLESLLNGNANLAAGKAGADKSGSEAGEEDQIEDAVVGIVANEISANSSRQAILAQCVIARTSLYDAGRTKTAEPQSLSIEEMKKLWGEEFQTVYQTMEECAAMTRGEVLTWNGSFIYAAYHAVSAGKTRNMAELYEDADMPYLRENLCSGDTEAEGYLSVHYWGKNEFEQSVREAFPENFSGQMPPEETQPEGTQPPDALPEETQQEEARPDFLSQIEIIRRDSAGYVLEVRVGENTCTGEEFRSRLALNSACFTITDIGDQVRIVTKGLGHGFGLSQYTANLMAAEGKSYEEILAYFYPGAELSDASSF